MICPLCALVILAGTLASGGEVSANDEATRKELIRLEREWSDAIVKRDALAIDRVLADDYVLTTPEGRLVTKAMVLDNLKRPRDPSFVITAADQDEVSARIYGETAVISSRFTLKARAGERDVETPFRHTDIFVKQQGRWRSISRQATRIVELYDPANER